MVYSRNLIAARYSPHQEIEITYATTVTNVIRRTRDLGLLATQRIESGCVLKTMIAILQMVIVIAMVVLVVMRMSGVKTNDTRHIIITRMGAGALRQTPQAATIKVTAQIIIIAATRAVMMRTAEEMPLMTEQCRLVAWRSWMRLLSVRYGLLGRYVHTFISDQ